MQLYRTDLNRIAVDESGNRLEDVLHQYVFFFTSNTAFPITDSNILLTQQDIEDIISFLKIL